MITLVTGGSKCGKSSLAEKILCSGDYDALYYLATMQPFGNDAHEAIERHRKMRSGKGFETIEKYTGIHEAEVSGRCGILLECMGNLCANEMFTAGGIIYPADRIMSSLRILSAVSEHLVIVTNEVGADGISYTPETEMYIKAMSEINSRTAEKADNVIECVYGIPVILKGVLPC